MVELAAQSDLAWALLLPIGVGVLIVGLVIYGAVVLERRRREGLAAFAAQYGYDFDARAEGVLQREFASLPLFSRGHGRRATNLLHHGRRESELRVFDYRFTTGGGKNQHTHHQTVVAFELHKQALPQFEVRPENIFHKIGQAFGYQDFDFAEYPDFSARFLVRGREELAVRHVLCDALITTLQSAGDICLEGGGAWLIVYRAGRRTPVDRLAAFIDEAMTLRSALPRR